MAASARTIVLKGQSSGSHHKEGVLDTIGTPGMHVQFAADGKWDLSPQTAAELVKMPLHVLKEDALQGKTITDAYAIGDLAFIYTPRVGDNINALVKSGENIAVGDHLTPEGGGTGLFIEAAGTEAVYRLKANESTGGALGANGYVNCEVIN